MTSARVAAMALVLAAGSVGTVRAQAPWPGEPPRSGEAPWPGNLPWPGKPLWQSTAPTPPNAAPQKCVAEFTALRSQVEREGIAARAGIDKRLSRAEMCKLVTAYSAAETTWVRHTEMNMTKCGIPDHVVKQMKIVHAKTNQGLIKLCTARLSPADSREKNPEFLGEKNPDFRFGPPTQPHDFPPRSLPRFSGR